MSRDSRQSGFYCRCCGHFHPELPLHYRAEAPLLYTALDDIERSRRCTLTSELCVIDERLFFVCGNLELPIRDSELCFSWDVWASLSPHNFARMCDLWEASGRELEPSYFGWLSTRLPGYPDTVSLKTHVHTRAVGRRPFIELEATDHPLAVEQRVGITWDRVQEIAEQVLHGSPPGSSGNPR